MKKLNVIFLTSLIFVTSLLKAEINDPLASKGAIVVAGNVRFTVLTPRIIRMEWDSTGLFCDNASFIAVNRNLAVPEYSVKRSGKYITIKTSEVELKYKINSGKFTSQNLIIKYLDKRNSFLWKPGEKQKGNLKGTYRTLDGYNGAYSEGRFNDEKAKIPIEDGLLSTDGWTLIDDSRGLLFDKSDWPWVEERKNPNGQDWYFMAYGKNYKEALKEYTEFAGKVPLPPRYAFGYWWSRWWDYSDNELRTLVNNFKRYNIPLDVLVIDMDWHADNVNQKQHWTGWTWNKNLFPDYKEFLKWTDNEGIKTTLDLHPAEGVASFEDCYKDFAKEMGVDLASPKTIPYEGSNKHFMETLFDQVLNKYQKEGIDFWWLDWQQWPNDKKLTNLSNTWWLNYMFFTDMERSGNTRPLLYHRWGGLGNHRYQVGFSGDTHISWQSLAFQPYFTSTASNVLYTYWSHDIGGFCPVRGNKVFDPELYVRWIQYGALSPMFRTHCSKDKDVDKTPWNFAGEYFNAIQNSIQLRYRLVPYIYTMARKTYDQGIGLCRPLYYDYPEDKQAYADSSEYMFGDNILVATIGKPMENGVSKVKVWLPEGNDWFEWNTGTMLKGGQEIEREFSLDEYPVYVKAGAVIPMYKPGLKNLESEPNALEIDVFPGKEGTLEIYDDSGLNKDYAKEYSFTKVSSTKTGTEQRITIDPVEGSYKGMPESRDYFVKVCGVGMPEKIMVNGKEIPYNTVPKSMSWRYIGNELSFEVAIKELGKKDKAEIEITYRSEQGIDLNCGLVRDFKTFSKRYTEAKAQGKLLNFVPEAVGKCEETNREIEYDPQNFYKYIKYFMDNKDKAFDAMK